MIARKILVFGGTGHVGSHLVADLVVAGFEVVVISRNPPKPSRLVASPAVRYHHASVHEPENWRGELEGALAVVDAIGILAANKRRDHSHESMNFEPCRITLQAALAAGVPGFVYISARPLPGPFLADYYAAKAKAEALVKDLHPRGLIVTPGIVLGGPSWIQSLVKIFPMVSTVREVNDQILDYCRALINLV